MIANTTLACAAVLDLSFNDLLLSPKRLVAQMTVHRCISTALWEAESTGVKLYFISRMWTCNSCMEKSRCQIVQCPPRGIRVTTMKIVNSSAAKKIPQRSLLHDLNYNSYF